MPQGDIDLPNRSGAVDPRIEREAALERQRAFLRQDQARRAARPAVRRSVAGQMLDGYRRLKGTR